MGRLRSPKQITSTKVHILSPIALLESAEGETKVRCRMGYRTSDFWLLSQTLSMMVYAKFQYSLNALFCEPSEICEYKRKLNMYRVPEFRTMLIFTNYGPLKRSPDLAYLVRIPPASEFVIPQTVLRCPQNFFHYLFNNACMHILEPLIHDNKYGDKRYNNNAICLINLNKRAKLILPNLLVD